MIALLIAFALTNFPPGTWHWDPSATATGYEFCWSYDPERFSRALCVDVGASTSFLPSIELQEVWHVAEGGVLFFQVCAYNAAGFDEECAAFDPVPPDWTCP